MSTVDELLAYVGVVEASGEFKVNLSARKIEVPESAGVLGVTSDECVRPVTFRIPRWYFETDLAAFDWSVNYRNAAGETARALMRVEDVDDSEFSFEWLIPRHACAQDGKVSFALCGILHGDDGASIAQEWNTVPAEFTVPQGLESDVTEEELRLDWVWKVVADCEAATDEARRAAGEVADEAKSALRQLQSVMHFAPDEPPVLGDGMAWLVTDEEAQRVVGLRRWDADREGQAIYPGPNTFPGPDTFMGRPGDWTDFTISADLIG